MWVFYAYRDYIQIKFYLPRIFTDLQRINLKIVEINSVLRGLTPTDAVVMISAESIELLLINKKVECKRSFGIRGLNIKCCKVYLRLHVRRMSEEKISCGADIYK